MLQSATSIPRRHRRSATMSIRWVLANATHSLREPRVPARLAGGAATPRSGEGGVTSATGGLETSLLALRPPRLRVDADESTRPTPGVDPQCCSASSGHPAAEKDGQNALPALPSSADVQLAPRARMCQS